MTEQLSLNNLQLKACVHVIQHEKMLLKLRMNVLKGWMIIIHDLNRFFTQNVQENNYAEKLDM